MNGPLPVARCLKYPVAHSVTGRGMLQGLLVLDRGLVLCIVLFFREEQVGLVHADLDAIGVRAP
jgi:hypothetical protein